MPTIITNCYGTATPTSSSSILSVHQQQQFVPDCPSAIDQSKFENFQEIFAGIDRLLVLTGAGISTESGIPDYRSKLKGRYEKHRPITHQEFMGSEWWRKRYWARNFLAWPRFSSAQCNETHIKLAELERNFPERFLWLITQNVDGLHGQAGSQKLTELHGSGRAVRCMSCENKYPRELVQSWMTNLNADWVASLGKLDGEFRPDGDMDVPERAFLQFRVPHCPDCGPDSILKTDVVFFGDNVPGAVVEQCYQMVNECTGMLVLGSSLTVMSGLRFVLQAVQREVPLLIVNIGETRADPWVTVKLEAKCSEVISRLAAATEDAGWSTTKTI